MPSPTAGPTDTPVLPATTSPSATPSPSSTPAPSATPTPTATPTESPTPIVAGSVTLTPREQWLFDAHNAERVERGIPPLQIDGRLQLIARERAKIMADNDLFSHYSPSGETIYDLMAAAGYVYASDATENIHYNDVAPSQADAFAMREYMASPPHRANILDPNLIYAGFAMETSVSGVHYYSVVLAD